MKGFLTDAFSSSMYLWESTCGSMYPLSVALPISCSWHWQQVKSKSLQPGSHVEPTLAMLSCFCWEDAYHVHLTARVLHNVLLKPLNLALPNRCFSLLFHSQKLNLPSDSSDSFFGKLWCAPVSRPHGCVDENEAGDWWTIHCAPQAERNSQKARRMFVLATSWQPCIHSPSCMSCLFLPDILPKWSRLHLRSSTACGSTETWGVSTKR